MPITWTPTETATATDTGTATDIPTETETFTHTQTQMPVPVIGDKISVGTKYSILGNLDKRIMVTALNNDGQLGWGDNIEIFGQRLLF